MYFFRGKYNEYVNPFAKKEHLPAMKKISSLMKASACENVMSGIR